MIIDNKQKQMLMEVRDINYILSAYIRSYLFYSKNEDPDKIVFPMFQSVPHPLKAGVNIDIEWVPLIDPVAIEIIEDGSDIPEVTPEQEEVLDKKDDEVKELKAEVSSIGAAFTKAPKPVVVPTLPARHPKLPPGGDIGPGLALSDMHKRSADDQAKTAMFLKDEPNIEGTAEKEYDKKITRGEDGKLIVEDK